MGRVTVTEYVEGALREKVKGGDAHAGPTKDTVDTRPHNTRRGQPAGKRGRVATLAPDQPPTAPDFPLPVCTRTDDEPMTVGEVIDRMDKGEVFTKGQGPLVTYDLLNPPQPVTPSRPLWERCQKCAAIACKEPKCQCACHGAYHRATEPTP